jgi:hypothetical protein
MLPELTEFWLQRVGNCVNHREFRESGGAKDELKALPTELVKIRGQLAILALAERGKKRQQLRLST